MAILKLFLFFMTCIGVSIPIDVPKREVGYVYKSGTNPKVRLDFYIDQTCPFSQQAFPNMLKLADEYGPDKLQLRTHLFPLPYHRNSFYASKGTHIIDKLTSGRRTYEWIKTIFDNRPSLTGGATHDMSDEQIVQEFADIAKTKFGVDTSTFTTMIMSGDIEMATRLGWKYCCTRGVSGTPTFMVNDVIVDGDSSWNVTDWKKITDPLMT